MSCRRVLTLLCLVALPAVGTAGVGTSKPEVRDGRAHVQAVAASFAQRADGADATSWEASKLALPQAWQITQGNPATVVAVIDTGVDADHPALLGRVLPGYDAVDGGGDTSDAEGHGTAVAGIVAATCPGCRILPVKVAGPDLTADWGTIAAGVNWAADHGAQVINLSVGAPAAPDVLATAIAHALADGVIVVAAAGNDGRDETFYPAMYPGVVSVAGVDESSARYNWSNFGSWVTVAAPGCATTTWVGGGYQSSFCGTSTAAPFVAGTAGLARSLDPTLTPTQFAAAVAASSDPAQGPPVSAFGVLDAAKLLQSVRAESLAGAAGMPSGRQGRLTEVLPFDSPRTASPIA